MVSHSIANLAVLFALGYGRAAPGQVYFPGSVPHALPLCSDRLCPCPQVNSALAHLLPTTDMLGLLSAFEGLCCYIQSGGVIKWFELKNTLKIL